MCLDLPILEISYTLNQFCVWRLPFSISFHGSSMLCVSASFFLWPNNILLYACATFFMHSSAEVSTFRQLWIMLLWMFLSKFLYGHVFSFLLGLAGSYGNCWTLWGTTKLSKVAVAFYVSISKLRNSLQNLWNVWLNTILTKFFFLCIKIAPTQS